MSLPRNSKLLVIAKNLRKNMTLHEKRLWYDFLRSYPTKIYKQKIIGNFIVDFYCDKAKLIIELDGSQHFQSNGIEYDKQRTEHFSALGIKVVRFTNSDLDKNFEGVCEQIDQIIRKQ